MFKGSILLDTFLGHLIFILIFGTTLISFHQLYHHIQLQTVTKVIYHHLNVARWHSLSTDQDVMCHVSTSQLIVSSLSEHKRHDFSYLPVQLKSNRHFGIGFKSNFMTRSAGRLSINQRYHILLPVGLAVLRWE